MCWILWTFLTINVPTRVLDSSVTILIIIALFFCVEYSSCSYIIGYFTHGFLNYFKYPHGEVRIYYRRIIFSWGLVTDVSVVSFTLKPVRNIFGKISIGAYVIYAQHVAGITGAIFAFWKFARLTASRNVKSLKLSQLLRKWVMRERTYTGS